MNSNPFDLYAPLQRIMAQCGATVSPEEFYWAVNLAYHAVESATYVKAHAPMITVLPTKWEKLLAPLALNPLDKLRWLDIGCGPGVLGDVFDKLIGERFEKAVFLDPSIEMIEQCKKASANWSFQSQFIVGKIDDILDSEQFDVVTANSVLHHVVELEALCAKVVKLVKPGGYFMTCFDPRMEASHDPVFRRRGFAYQWLKKGNRGIHKLYRILTGSSLPPSQYEAETNAKLLTSGIIVRPLSMREIWAVTDFHVPGQPGQIGSGIAVEQLKKYMYPLNLDEYFTYQYFGDTEPMRPFQWLENWYTRFDDMHGQLFGARWYKPIEATTGKGR